ncbi:ABC transporter ATP-binding protein [Lysinibacter cavernae]|uniref:Putative ABC transport system ATP-binding protein n=1 Tax=Lysinibacter cavernae TaxID=1640652 RepID=A0A7X5QZQ8_9MICO|nr:ABC transporter ATP-binding protein [Lysinibacter cavernae]NIH52772.1 putative ABC transport system ATP-binding protein [Lysinibacter cavernae]
MIQLSDLTVTFPDGNDTITALNAVSLRVAPGTVSAITGPSGSGKSTLLSVASTLLTPTSGNVEIGGVDASALTSAERAKLRRDSIGIVFQQPNLLSALTVRDQLVVMSHLGQRRLRGNERSAYERRADELLDAVGLAGQRQKRASQLSGGQRQRVNIARALMNEPTVIVVDEPTSALDQQRGSEIIDLVITLTQERKTSTLLVTHDLSHLTRFDEVHTMIDGSLYEGLIDATTVSRESLAGPAS